MYIGLTYFAYFLQFFFVDDFDFAAVDSDELFGGKLRQSSDGVGSGHVGEIGQVFAGEVDAQR